MIKNNINAAFNLAETQILSGNNNDALSTFINILLQFPVKRNIRKKLSNLIPKLNYKSIELLNRFYEFEKYFPTTFIIETALACNLKCPECAIGGGMIDSRNKGYLTFDRFKIIADKIKPYAKYLYMHLWGEPMLNKNIIKMIRYAAEFTSTNISTNATILTEEKIEELILSGVKNIIVSIDGTSQEVYEKYRVGGKAAVALKNLELLAYYNKKHLHKVNIIPQFIVFKHNQHEIESFKNICKSLELTPYFKSPYIRTQDSKLSYSDFKEYRRLDYPDMKSLKEAMSECINPRNVFSINIDGSTIICCHDYNSQTSFGNIFEHDVAEIWNSPSYRKFRWNIFNKLTPEFCLDNCMTYYLAKGSDKSFKNSSINYHKINVAPKINVSKKINLCSGSIYLGDYINIDIGGNTDIKIDLEEVMLPFEDNSIDAVVCISAINYFTRERGQEIINDVYRILKPGGIARFGAQDLKILTGKYLTRDDNFYFEKLNNGDERYPGKTFADKLNHFFYGFESSGKMCKYVYDFETLKLLFDEAGFEKIEQKNYLESDLPNVEKIDNRPEQMFFLEAVKKNNIPNIQSIYLKRNDNNITNCEKYVAEIRWNNLLEELEADHSNKELVLKCGKLLNEIERYENELLLYKNYLRLKPYDSEIIHQSEELSERLKKNKTKMLSKYKPREIQILDSYRGKSLSDLEHLEAAINWLYEAYNSTSKRGVSALYNLMENKWDVAYPETTGYIIPTFLHYSQITDKSEFKDYAIEMGEWELAIQWEEGGIGEPYGVYGQKPRIFNTSQVMLGWMSLYKYFSEMKFLKASIKAADWIIKNQDLDGKWLLNTYRGPKSYHARVAWSLLELFEITKNPKYKLAAEKSINWVLAQSNNSGWFDNTSLSDPAKPWTHLIGYTLTGMMEIYLLNNCSCDREKIYSLLGRAADAIAEAYSSSQYPAKKYYGLPGSYNCNWKSEDDWSCLTGNAQIEFFLRKFSQIARNREIQRISGQLSEEIKNTQFIDKNLDKNIIGSLSGSYPVSGDYCAYLLPNWSAKFLADGLMLKLNPGKEFKYLS